MRHKDLQNMGFYAVQWRSGVAIEGGVGKAKLDS
jgi:hypothetical protein